jgi:hypothetical protein
LNLKVQGCATERLKLAPFILLDTLFLFLGVHALGDAATWPTERHSQEQSRRPRLSEAPCSLSCAAKRKGQAMVINLALTTALDQGMFRGDVRSLSQRLQNFSVAASKKDKPG